MSFNDLKNDIAKIKNDSYAKTAQWFFKTEKGQYGYGDIFLGIRVPQIRILAGKYKQLSFKDLNELIRSKYHEERLLAVIILTIQYKKGLPELKEKIFRFYLNHLEGVNNWDLVDLSCDKIIGKHLLNSDRNLLFEFAKSDNLWKRRIAMISTFEFIRNLQFDTSFMIADILIQDKHDLIHKAVGWMLREIGKRDFSAEESFLISRYNTMPRTMLRYAIEKFPESLRQKYLKGLI